MALVGGSTTFCPGDRSYGLLIGPLWPILKIINWFNYYLPSVQISDHKLVLILFLCKCWVIWHGHGAAWKLCKNWRCVQTLDIGGSVYWLTPYDRIFIGKPLSGALSLMVGQMLMYVALAARAGCVTLKHIRIGDRYQPPEEDYSGQLKFWIALSI